jgi:hypothetical protein
MKRVLAAMFVLSATAFGACEDSERVYFTIRSEPRFCRQSSCAGFYVKRANQAQTRCADGSLQAECFVRALDLASLGLTTWEETFTRDAARREEVVLKGEIALRGGEAQLSVVEAWYQSSWRSDAGFGREAYYWVKKEPIVCLTTPCFNIRGTKLEGDGTSRLYSDLSNQLYPRDLARLATEGLVVLATEVGGEASTLALMPHRYYVKTTTAAWPTACFRTGCGNELCATTPVSSTCEGRPQDECLRFSACQTSPAGDCRWVPTPEMQQCLDKYGISY